MARLSLHPVDSYILCLDLRRVFNQSVPSRTSMLGEDWSLKIAIGVGVPKMLVLDAYERYALRQQTGKDAQRLHQLAGHEQTGLFGSGDEERIDQLTGIVSVVEDWVQAASTSSETQLQEVCQSKICFPSLFSHVESYTLFAW